MGRAGTLLVEAPDRRNGYVMVGGVILGVLGWRDETIL